jgi:hypothetical protein
MRDFATGETKRLSRFSIRIASWLTADKDVWCFFKKKFYPGLKSHTQYTKKSVFRLHTRVQPKFHTRVLCLRWTEKSEN